MMKLVNVLALLVLLLSCIAVSHANYWEVEDVEATVPPTTTEAGTTPVAGTTPEGTTPEGTTPEGTTPEGTTPEGTTASATTTTEATVTTTEATVTTTESSSGAETTKSGGSGGDGGDTTTTQAGSTQAAATSTQAANVTSTAAAATSTAAASTAAPVTSTAAASTAAGTTTAPAVAQPGDVTVTASFGMRTEKHRSQFPLTAFDDSIAAGLNVTRANVHSAIKNSTRKRADEFTVVTSIVLKASELSRTATVASSLKAAANNTAVANVLASAGAQITSVSVSTVTEPNNSDNINGGASGKNMGFAAAFALVASVFAFAL